MNVVSTRREELTQVVGRLSDGSDRQEVTRTVWVVRYRGDDGELHEAQFDHAPTSAELNELSPLYKAARTRLAQIEAMPSGTAVEKIEQTNALLRLVLRVLLVHDRD